MKLYKSSVKYKADTKYIKYNCNKSKIDPRAKKSLDYLIGFSGMIPISRLNSIQASREAQE